MHSWAFSKTRFSTGLFRFEASQGYKLKKTFSSDLWKVSCDLWKVLCDLWKMFCNLWKTFCDLWKMFSDLWKLALRKFVFADFQIDFRKLWNSNEQIFCIWITGNQVVLVVVIIIGRYRRGCWEKNCTKKLQEECRAMYPDSEGEY